MRTMGLVEGMVLFIISVVSIIEAVRLIVYKDPRILYDKLGPGYYVLIFGIFLMATSIAYIIVNYRQGPSMGKELITKEMRYRLIGAVGVCAIYLLLIGIIGYLVSTILFYLMEYRIFGVKSWRRNIIITSISTASYYFVFIKYCQMVFPHPIIFW